MMSAGVYQLGNSQNMVDDVAAAMLLRMKQYDSSMVAWSDINHLQRQVYLHSSQLHCHIYIRDQLRYRVKKYYHL